MAYKNESQYTTLIHGGENVTINPPGFINVTGGGGGVSPDDLKAPLALYNKNNEEIGFITSEGNVYLDGTVYINGDTDVQELSPIFDIDIIGDYSNNTFTSSQSFSDIVEALETGHTLIARDVNGFVYQHTGSELTTGEAENSVVGSLYFASIQPDGLYLLTWTENSRVISVVTPGGGSGDGVYILITTRSQEDPSTWTSDTTRQELISVYNSGTPIFGYETDSNRWYYLEYASLSNESLQFIWYSPWSGDTDFVYAMSWQWSDIEGEEEYESKAFYQTEMIQFNEVYTDGVTHVTDGDFTSYFFTDPELTSPCDNDTLEYICIPQNSYNHLNRYDLYYIENGNRHLMYKQMSSDGDWVDGSEYGFSSLEGFSSNTLIIYNMLLTVNVDSETDAVNIIPTIYTHTITTS